MQEILVLREHFLVEGKKTECAMLHGNYIVSKYRKSAHKRSSSSKDKHVKVICERKTLFYIDGCKTFCMGRIQRYIKKS